MANIDYSSKHDILIRNFDGTYQPMDEPFFEAEKIADDTWKILSDGDYTYLIAGEKKAMVVDSGYGAGNIREFCETLVNVPIDGIINTHHHFDHTANNSYFDNVYMDPKAVDFATVPYPSFEGIVFPRNYHVITVTDGYTFDLGGRILEVFRIPDHTEDGIAILDRREKLLYSGDEFMKSKNLSSSVEHWKSCLEKLMVHRQEFERLCAGEGILPARIVDLQYKIVNDILSGNEGEEMKRPDNSGRPGGPGEGRTSGPRPGDPPGFNPMNPENYQGHKVYYRKFPHPEDVQRVPKSGDAIMKCVEIDGYRMMYDSNKIYEKEN